MTIQEMRSFKTSDGQLFDNRVDAEKHEKEWEFKTWCRDNICRGGEWDADMVSAKILEYFYVSRKPIL